MTNDTNTKHRIHMFSIGISDVKERVLKIVNCKLKITLLCVALFLFPIFYFLITAPVSAATISTPPNNLGLVGYWSFDDGSGTSLSDLSGNANNGTLNGNPEWVSGKKAGALDFDGTTDEVNIGNIDSIDGASEASICFWLLYKPSSVTKDSAIVSKWGNDNGGWLAWVDDVGNSFGQQNTVTFAFNAVASDGGRVEAVTDSVTSGVWEHWCGVFEGGTAIHVYENGELNNSNTTSITATVASAAHDLIIADSANTTNIKHLNGKVDDVRIYNRALSASEISSLYGSGAATVRTPHKTDSLIHHWKLDDRSGTTAEDSVGTNDGTLVNMEPAEDWVEGKYLGALNIDGSNTSGADDRVSITGTTLSRTSSAISFWVRPGVVPTNNYGGRMHMFSDGNVYQSYIGLNPGYQLRAEGQTNGDYWSGATGDATVPQNTWTHVILSADSGTVTSYINGVVVDTQTPSSNLYISQFSNAGSWGCFGTDCDEGTDFQGQLDDIRIYNAPLSASDVQSLYSEGLTVHNVSQETRISDGLVGMWTFDGPDVSGTTISDVSGNGNDGTATNGPKPARGVIGQAYEFDGVDDYVDVPDTPILDLDETLTLSAWIKPDVLGILHDSVVKTDGDLDDTPYLLRIRDTNLASCTIFDGSSYGTVVGSTVITIDEWHHIACTHDGSTFKVYVNGVLDGTTSTSVIPANSNGTFRIGDNPRQPDRELDGTIDNVRIYDRTLSDEEIFSLYKLGGL